MIRYKYGTGADEDLIGTGGIDWIFGYGGKDRLYGQGGDDWLFGGAGNDLLDGGEGRDHMFGGAGDDIYRVDDPGDVVSEEDTPGVDAGGVDYVQSTISYNLGNFIEKLELLGTASINGIGNNLANTIKGNDGSNVLSGMGGSDILYGYGGNDILVGGAGKDYLTGGTGSDTFVLGAPDATSADRIYDFETADRIGIYAANYGLNEGNGLTGGVLSPAYFVVGSVANSAGHGQFIYNPSNNILYWDPDGTGSTGRITLATLSPGAAVTAAQFRIMHETPSISVESASATAIAEDAGKAYFLISLDAPAREDVIVTYSTVDGSATGGNDFVAVTSAQVVIPAGTTSIYVGIDLIDNNFAEGVESFSLQINSAQLASSGQALVGGATAASVDIADEGPHVVNAIDTAALGIPDPSGLAYAALGIPDPSGLAYHAGLGRLFLSDSEVDESPFGVPTDLYAFGLDGTLHQSFNLDFTSEATGLAFDPNSGLLFISDDDEMLVYWVNPADPTVRLGSFNTLAIGGDDPEDIAIDPASGHLFIVNGESRTIVETNVTGSQMYSSILLPPEILDPEALVYDPRTDTFFVGGGFSATIWQVDRSGAIVNTIDVLADFRHPDNNTRVCVKDLELAPASDGSGEAHLYVADFGWSHVNDGRIIEIDLGDEPAPVMMAMMPTETPEWA